MMAKRIGSRPCAGRGKAWKQRALANVSGMLLLACMHPLMASAGSTFPDLPDQRAADQRAADKVGPAEPRDTAVPPPAHRNREEIEADIQALEAERTNLLAKYASAHPDVRAVERRLQVRRKQLEMLKQAPTPPK